MRIDRTNEITKLYQNKKATAVAKVEHQRSDALDISTQAMEYTKAIQAAKQVPDLRMEKVQAIQQQINSGTYTINAEEVASKMVNLFDMKG